MKSAKSKNLVATGTLILAAVVGAAIWSADESARAQAPGPDARLAAPIQGLSRQPTAAARAALLDPNDTVVLLLDHQTGLFNTVKDVPLPELRANTVGLAKIA